MIQTGEDRVSGCEAQGMLGNIPDSGGQPVPVFSFSHTCFLKC